MSDALRLAFGTLTTWKVPPPREITPRAAGRAMLLAPVVMLPLLLLVSLALAGLQVLGSYSAPPAVLASLLVTVHVLSTRGMHLDGIADVADGLSASYDRARALEIMKRSDVGPSGVAAIVLAIALQVTSLAYLAQHGALVAAGVAVLASRATLAWGCHRSVPNATPTGLGATVARSVSTPLLTVSTIALFAVAAAASLLSGTHPVVTNAAVVGAVVANLLLLARCRSRLGGITGDVLGAGIEIGFTAGLVAAALAV